MSPESTGRSRQEQGRGSGLRGIWQSIWQQLAQFEASHLPAGNRVEWVDYAKGVCIILVVTLYATHHVQQLAGGTGWMQHVVDFAQPFRMPDFFLLSGLFVPRVIRRPLRAYIDSKVLYFVYFYAVWATFRFAYTDLRGALGADKLALLGDYLFLYVEPPSGPLWFIYMLAFFFIAVRLLQRVPPLPVLLGASVLQMMHPDTGITLVDKFAAYFVFFYSGYLFSRHVFGAAEWAGSRKAATIAILAAWAASNLLLVQAGLSTSPGASLLLGYAGAFAVLLFATLLAHMPWTQWLRYLGRNSIVVYLGFVIPLGFMRGIISRRSLVADIGELSLLATVVSVIGAVLLYWAVRATPLRFLFQRPAWTHIPVEPGPPRKGEASMEAGSP